MSEPPAAATPAEPAPEPAPAVDPFVAAIAPGYQFEGPALELGGLMRNATDLSDVRIRIPLGMLNRHGLVAGATGTGKTKTLQLLAEQLSAEGVPVFAADIKGDLSGLSGPGRAERQDHRPRAVGRPAVGGDRVPGGVPTRSAAQGAGIPLRVTISTFGPMLLTQGPRTQRHAGVEPRPDLPLRRPGRAAAAATSRTCARSSQYLTSDEGKADLKGLGGLSSATAGVILRELIAFEDQGADAFFGEPEFEAGDLLQVAPTARA